MTITDEQIENITNAAYVAYRNWHRGIRGTTITYMDSMEFWVIRETQKLIQDAYTPVIDKLAHCLKCHRHDMLAGEDITWEDRDDDALAEYATLQSPENA